MKASIVQIVDSVEYARSNCFQQQLAFSLEQVANVSMVTLEQVKRERVADCDSVICCLRQRTVSSHMESLARFLDGRQYVFYDQDPWHSYMDDSQYKGVYDRLVKQTNVRSIAVTTKWWTDFMNSRGIPSDFVKMWILPSLCVVKKPFDERTIDLGFIGGVHAHRKMLFDELARIGLPVTMVGGGFSYGLYLEKLNDIKTYIHSEDRQLMIDGKSYDAYAVGLWAREIEVCSQGCFCIRNNADGKDSYLNNIETAFTYEYVTDIPDILQYISSLSTDERDAKIKRTVEYIRDIDEWTITAKRLIELGAR